MFPDNPKGSPVNVCRTTLGVRQTTQGFIGQPQWFAGQPRGFVGQFQGLAGQLRGGLLCGPYKSFHADSLKPKPDQKCSRKARRTTGVRRTTPRVHRTTHSQGSPDNFRGWPDNPGRASCVGRKKASMHMCR